MKSPNVDPGHPGSPRRFDPEIRVLVHAAPLRRDPEPSGRLQEDVRFRLVPLGVLRPDEDLHQLAQQRCENAGTFEEGDESARLQGELACFLSIVSTERRPQVQRFRDALLRGARQLAQPVECVVNVLVLESRRVQFSF